MTKEQAIEIVTNFLTKTKKLSKEYYIETAFYEENHSPIRGDDTPISIWTVAVHDDSIFDTTDFYIISDVTGDLLYGQSKHGITIIEKGVDGFYWKK